MEFHATSRVAEELSALVNARLQGAVVSSPLFLFQMLKENGEPVWNVDEWTDPTIEPEGSYDELAEETAR